MRTPREGTRCTKRWCTAKADTQINKKRERSKTGCSHIENGNKEPIEKCDGDANIGRNPPRGGKRGGFVRDLTPVEGENTHGKAMGSPKELVYLGIVRSYPANPRKA
jgi:hypothetical protein